MEFSDLKLIWNDKVKRAYLISFSTIIMLVYVLLIKYDLGGFAALTNELQKAETNLRDVTDISENTHFVNKFDNDFTIAGDTRHIIELITTAAKERSVEIDLIRPLKSFDTSGYRKVRVLIEGRAKYHQVGHFVSALENTDKFLVIEELSLRGEQEEVMSEGNVFISGAPGVQGGFPPGMDSSRRMPQYSPGMQGQYPPEMMQGMGGYPPGMMDGMFPPGSGQMNRQGYPPEMMQGQYQKEPSTAANARRTVGDGTVDVEGDQSAETGETETEDDEPKTIFKLVITGFKIEK